MTKDTRKYTVEGRRNGKDVTESFRDYSVKKALRTAKRLGIEPMVIRDYYGIVWIATTKPQDASQ